MHQLVEILGTFLGVVGCGVIVGAAALVSVPLAVLVAGVFLVAGGLTAVYLAAVLDSGAKATAKADRA